MRRLFGALLVVIALAAVPLAAVSAAPTYYLPPASHETSVRAEWDLTSPGPATRSDTFLAAWTPPSTTWDGAGAVQVVFTTSRFSCDVSSDTWRFRWSFGSAQVPRSALAVSGRGATLDADVSVETRENAGSGCTTANRYGSPGVLIGTGTISIAATWDVNGRWEAHRSCSLDQAGALLFVGTSRSASDVAASMTVTGPVRLTAPADRLVEGSLWRDTTTARPNNGQWPCPPGG